MVILLAWLLRVANMKGVDKVEKDQFNNQAFCYWLQGYFEIAKSPHLTEPRFKKIAEKLDKIEYLGPYTSWLKQVITILENNAYAENLLSYFTPLLIKELNHIFQHDIDPSYETDHSAEYLSKIHHGETSLTGFNS